jgi:hypothetical protein
VVTGWTTDFDTDSPAFNPTTGVYTVPSSGIWNFRTQITLTSSTIGLNIAPQLHIRVNGQVMATSTDTLTLSVLGTLQATMDTEFQLELVAGNLVDVTLTNATNLTLNLSNPTLSMFSGFMLNSCTGPVGPAALGVAPQPFVFSTGFFSKYANGPSTVGPGTSGFSSISIPTGTPGGGTTNIWGTRVPAPLGATTVTVRAEASILPAVSTTQHVFIGVGQSNVCTNLITLDPSVTGIDYTDRPAGPVPIPAGPSSVSLSLTGSNVDLWVTGDTGIAGNLPTATITIGFA